jgi:hypothetical protein
MPIKNVSTRQFSQPRPTVFASIPEALNQRSARGSHLETMIPTPIQTTMRISPSLESAAMRSEYLEPRIHSPNPPITVLIF